VPQFLYLRLPDPANNTVKRNLSLLWRAGERVLLDSRSDDGASSVRKMLPFPSDNLSSVHGSLPLSSVFRERKVIRLFKAESTCGLYD
jgi:hypothetical protein